MYQLASLTYYLSCVLASLYEVIRECYGEGRLISRNAAESYQQIICKLCTQLEYHIFCVLCIYRHYARDNLHAIHLHSLVDEVVLKLSCLLRLKLINLCLQFLVVTDSLLYRLHEVWCVIEERLQVCHEVLHPVEHVVHLLTCDSLNTAHTSSHRTLGYYAHHAYLTGSLGVASTTELYRVAKLHYTYLVAILLAKQGNGAKLLSLLNRSIAELLQRNVFANTAIYKMLYLSQLLCCNFLKVREVEAQALVCYQ